MDSTRSVLLFTYKCYNPCMTEAKQNISQTMEFTTQQKTKFFANLATKNTGAFKQHAREGLWVRNEKGERDWGNVSEHCLVEIARVSVLADMIGLSKSVSKDLELAAGLHDAGKKQEKDIVT